jgi:type I restriction enzyme, S subunit
MNKIDSKGLVPELRFPEYVNEGKWLECSIDSIGDVVTGGTPSKEDKEYWGGEFVWITAQDLQEKYIFNSVLKLTQKGKDNSRVIPENSVLVTCIASIGLNGINKVECSTNQQINSIICNSKNNYEFVYYAVSYNNSRLKNLAGQTAVPIINKSVFEKFKIQIPQIPQEQQKIADCLSSIDFYINAQNHKLEALKVHKKGLMQQLFPVESQTVPKLRFEEFVDEGEWEETLLGQIGEFIGGGTPDTTISEYWDGEIQWFTPTEIKERIFSKSKRTITEKGLQNSSAKLLPKGALLITTRATIGDIGIANNPCATNQGFQSLIVNVSEINIFWYYWIIQNKNELIRRSSGSTFLEIGKSKIVTIPALRPIKEEQQKIADCISSLDDLITTQKQKLEALKLHKKGLMQQLFPTTE